jgi:hypothetical protein
MGFKTDTSFLRFLSMGARAVHRVTGLLREQGFAPIELERYCGSNKIWATKVKRLRLPDLLCVNTGLRIEVRAKTDLKIRMSDAPLNPARVWDAGNRDDDVVALVACFDTDDGPEPAGNAVFFTIKSLRDSVEHSRLGPPKSASEGAERDRTWPSIVPSRGGTVASVSPERLVVEFNDDRGPARRQTYNLTAKSPYVAPGDRFPAETTILAGAPAHLADLGSALQQRYEPLEELASAADVDRYAAVKALRFRDYPGPRVLPAVEDLLRHEQEQRVALEAAGTAAAMGSGLGQDRIAELIWHNADRPDLRMEAVFILTELGSSPFTREQLSRIATDRIFESQEVRQAAVWGLGKAGLKRYEDLLAFIDDADEDVALHAIAGFGDDTPQAVIDRLVSDLLAGVARRAPAASEALRIIGTRAVIRALLAAAVGHQPVPEWILATLGRLPSQEVREELRGSPLLERVSPMLLLAPGANWLTSDIVAADIAFLVKQNLC